MSETALQASIASALRGAGYQVERIQSGRLPMRGRYVHCASPGTPDLLVVAPYCWLETKTETGRLLPSQEEWHRKAAAKGVRVFVVRSVAEAIRAVKSCETEGGKAA